ncbi:MAG: glycoside hydrolase family 2 TIM barrel-domain containing protein [Eubacteriales bacterium]|nr:glycoside hydrolase family 2 TIM barrel-domain containing protein [Eubacteriales bacterium]
MERLFNTHNIRNQYCLDGMWDFQTVESESLPAEYTDTMAVPSCWEMDIKYVRYKGYAAYRKVINVEKDGNIRLLFKGVSHSGTVYFDGKRVGFHYNAFTPFSVVVPNVAKGEHTIEVVADNHFSEKSTLHIPNDYFTYGGITRPTFYEIISDLYIERSEFEPIFDKGNWSANVRVFIRNISDKKENCQITISCAGSQEIVSGEISANGETMLTATMTFNDVKPWSNKDPNLYLLDCVLSLNGEDIDDLTDRVGMRVVGIDGHRVTVNGEPIIMIGVNRHEDHGTTGCAIPLQVMYSDIALIEDMGANAVRTCHYPNDERFLDLCDERGIFVWEEHHSRGLDDVDITPPLFMEQSQQVTYEMLNYHYNHPSIVVWGCLNECPSDSEIGRPVYEKHFEMLHTDKSRPASFASNRLEKDWCLDLVDICSFNIYPLWYGDESPADRMTHMKEFLTKKGVFHKPVIISEFGAGGIYNFHDVMNVKWSEEYQAEVMEKSIKAYLDAEFVTGIFIWQFCDTRVTQEKWPMNRPNSRNNKGLVDEYRRPKMAYYTTKKLFTEFGKR